MAYAGSKTATKNIQLGNVAANHNQVFVHVESVSQTAAAVLTTTFIQDPISDHRFKVTLAGGETLLCEGTKDGTNFHTLLVVDEATGNYVVAASKSALPSGSYKIPLKTLGQYRQFKFTKSAAVQTVKFHYAVARPYRSQA